MFIKIYGIEKETDKKIILLDTEKNIVATKALIYLNQFKKIEIFTDNDFIIDFNKKNIDN
jgi:hypothetical protein